MEPPESVLERIHNDFPEADDKEIEEALSAYGQEPYHRERQRVLLYVLQLANGDKRQVFEFLKSAKRDYRDIRSFGRKTRQKRSSIPPRRFGLSTRCSSVLERSGKSQKIRKTSSPFFQLISLASNPHEPKRSASPLFVEDMKGRAISTPRRCRLR